MPDGPYTIRSTGQRYLQTQVTRPELLTPKHEADHVWVVSSVHVVHPAKLANYDTIHLDAENQALVMASCWRCNEPFSPELAQQACAPVALADLAG